MTIRTEDGREVLEDGERLSVNMMLMDSVQRTVAANTVVANDGIMHRPGFVTMTDAMMKDRKAVYDAYIARVTSAWKNPPAVLANATDGKAPLPHKPATDDRAKLYDAYDKKLSERWRGTAAA